MLVLVPVSGRITRNDTRNPIPGASGVLLIRSPRTGPENDGLLAGRHAHLSGMNEITPPVRAFLTQHELAELLQLPERTLEDWRLTGSGPPYMKLGRHVRYDIEDVLAWAKERRRG